MTGRQRTTKRNDMGDNFSIEVAGVLSDIIFETNVEDSFYYIKDKSYIPMSIRCRLLKVKRNKQTLYLVYFYISVNETVFEACCLSLDKQHLILFSMENGQLIYQYTLKSLEINEVYRRSDNQIFKSSDNFDAIMPKLRVVIDAVF